MTSFTAIMVSANSTGGTNTRNTNSSSSSDHDNQNNHNDDTNVIIKKQKKNFILDHQNLQSHYNICVSSNQKDVVNPLFFIQLVFLLGYYTILDYFHLGLEWKFQTFLLFTPMIRWKALRSKTTTIKTTTIKTTTTKTDDNNNHKRLFWSQWVFGVIEDYILAFYYFGFVCHIQTFEQRMLAVPIQMFVLIFFEYVAIQMFANSNNDDDNRNHSNDDSNKEKNNNNRNNGNDKNNQRENNNDHNKRKNLSSSSNNNQQPTKEYYKIKEGIDFRIIPFLMIISYLVWKYAGFDAEKSFSGRNVINFTGFAFGLFWIDLQFGMSHLLAHNIPFLWKIHRKHHEYARNELNLWATFHGDFWDILHMVSVLPIPIYCLYCAPPLFLNIHPLFHSIEVEWIHFLTLAHASPLCPRGFTLLAFWEFEALNMIFQNGSPSLDDYHPVHHSHAMKHFSVWGFVPDWLLAQWCQPILNYYYHKKQ